MAKKRKRIDFSEKIFTGGKLTLKQGSFGETDEYLFRTEAGAFVECYLERGAISWGEDTAALSFVLRNIKSRDRVTLQRLWERRDPAKRESLRVYEFVQKYARSDYTDWRTQYQWDGKRWRDKRFIRK